MFEIQKVGSTLTTERLRELFTYDPMGHFIQGGKHGKAVRGINVSILRGKCPYRKIRIDQKDYYLHRLIYQWHYGVVPVQLDHVNGIKTDNRIENLREANNTQNQWNQGPKKGRKFKGVFTAGKSYMAMINLGGKQIYLGTFREDVDAARAYDLMAERHHGEFAFLNFPQGAK